MVGGEAALGDVDSADYAGGAGEGHGCKALGQEVGGGGEGDERYEIDVVGRGRGAEVFDDDVPGQIADQ